MSTQSEKATIQTKNRKRELNEQRNHERVFVAAWDYPPIISGESIVCKRTLECSKFCYDVCCAPIKSEEISHITLYPVHGQKYLIWPFAVLKKYIGLNRQHHYKVMMSRVMPPNGHLAGLLIKILFPQVRWIAYFSDPISNSPFIHFSISKENTQRPNWLLMKVFGVFSNIAVKKADCLMFNNERLARFILGQKYADNHNRILILPYGHTGVKFRQKPKRNDNKLILTHVGQVYGNRSLLRILEAIELLYAKHPDILDKIEIRQVGFVSEHEKSVIKSSVVSGCFTILDQVTYIESIEEMYNSDYLLVVDPVFDNPQKNIYIPAKIYDYMSTGRDIICIADNNSATGDLSKKAGIEIINPIPDKIACRLEELLLTERQESNKTDVYNSFRFQADKLDSRIELLLK